MSTITTLTVDQNTKLLIEQAMTLLYKDKNVNFSIKDLMFLVFKRPEKIVELVNENYPM